MLPEVVHDREWIVTDEEKRSGEWKPTARLGVAYSEIIPVAVAAIQEQQRLIEKQARVIAKQQQSIEALQAEKETINARLGALEVVLKFLDPQKKGADGKVLFGE